MSAAFYAYIFAIFATLPDAVSSTAILGGGALRAFFDGSKVKDYDLFFRSKADFDAALIEMQASEFFREEAGNHVLSPLFVHIETGKEFNLIGFGLGTPEEQIARFDFRCCAIAAWKDENRVVRYVAAEGAIHDASHLLLNFVNNNGTDRTVRRATHYAEDYGYTVDGIGATSPTFHTHVRTRVSRIPVSTGGYP